MRKRFRKITAVLLALWITLSIWTTTAVSTTAASITENKVSADYSKESVVYLSGDSFVHVAGFLNNSYIDVYKYEDIYYKIDMDNELFSDCKIDMKIFSIDAGKESTVNIKQHTDSSEKYIRKGYYYYVPINISSYSGRINLTIILTFANGQVYYDSNNIVKLNLRSSSSAKISSGKCGDNLTWTLFQDGVLEIVGLGEMYNYGASEESPWKDYRQNIKSVSFGDGITSIGNYAFFQCNGINNVTIPPTVSSLGEGAFNQCSEIKKVEIYASISDIKEMTFLYCKKLEMISFPSTLTSIEKKAFSGCDSLKEIDIPSSVISIKSEAFFNCDALQKVSFHEGLKSIGEVAFLECDSLKEVILPRSIQTIDSHAFGYLGTGKIGFRKIDDFTMIGYSGSVAKTYADNNGFTFVNLKKDISNCRIEYTRSYFFTNTPKTPKVTVVDSDISETLVQNTDYTVAYSNNTNVGKATIIITGIGRYEGSVEKNFSIAYASISLNRCRTVNITPAGYMMYYALTPSKNMTIRYYSTGNFDTYGYLYDTNLNQLASNDDGGEDRNFQITYDLTAGTEYVFCSRLYDSNATGEFEICIEECSAETDTQKPTVSLSSTNNVASSQTVTIRLSDNIGIIGYYWGTSTDNTQNSFTSTTNSSVTKTVSTSGTYYVTAVDSSYNMSLTVSITFYKTTLDANGGAVSPTFVLTKSGNTLTFPSPTRSNYTYSGWSTLSDASSGVKTLLPSSNTIYYAVWKPNYTFVWGQDNWNFNNNSSYFGKYYYIDESIIPSLKSHFNIDNTDISDMYRKMNEKNAAKGFTGSCYGMTVSEMLVKLGFLNLADYGGYSIVNKNSNSNKIIISLINAIQLLQNTGNFSQTLRQTQFSRSSFSQYDFIGRIEDVLQNNRMFLKIGYSIKGRVKSNGNYIDLSSHAVLAYGIENCSYPSDITHKTYDRKILICDPNRLANNALSDEACIYYRSSDHSWLIPYWYGDYYDDTNGDYTGMCYWNAGSTLDTKTGSLNNIIKYDAISESVDLMSDFRTNHYIAGLELNSNNEAVVQEIANTGNPNMEYAGDGGSGIAKFGAEASLDETDLYDSYALWNPTANYTLSFSTPSSINSIMDYERISYYLDSSNSTYVLYKPSGFIQLNGSESDYKITLVTDDSECVTDWYEVTVSGSNADNVTYKKSSGGYILSATNLNNITISAKNDAVTASRIFSTNYNSVFIYEIDENTIGLKVDTDGNGTYETELIPDMLAIGDANGDGSININDVTSIQRHIADLEAFTKEQLAAADVNGDGKVDINDATHLQRYLAEFNVKLG